MVSISKISLTIFCLFLASCASPQWELVMRERQSAPGRGIDGQCAPWATEINKKLHEKGFRSKLVIWQWIVTTDAGSKLTGSHMAVAYQTKDGWWMIDNIAPKPIWVGKGETSWTERVKTFVYHQHFAPHQVPAQISITTNL